MRFKKIAPDGHPGNSALCDTFVYFVVKINNIKKLKIKCSKHSKNYLA